MLVKGEENVIFVFVRGKAGEGKVYKASTKCQELLGILCVFF